MWALQWYYRSPIRGTSVRFQIQHTSKYLSIILLLTTLFYCMLGNLQRFTKLFLYPLAYGHIIIRLASRSTALRVFLFFLPCFMKQQPPVGQGLVIIEASRSQTQHFDILLCTSDQPDAETSAWQHTTFTRDRYPCRPAGFEPAMPASERPQTHRTATWIGLHFVFITKIPNYLWVKSVIKLIGIHQTTPNKLGKVYYTSHEIIGFIRHYVQNILNNSVK